MSGEPFLETFEALARVERVLRAADVGDAAVSETVEVLGDVLSCRRVVAAQDLRALEVLIGRDHRDREPGLASGLDQRALAAPACAKDQTVDPALTDPRRDDGRVILVAEDQAADQRARCVEWSAPLRYRRGSA